MDTFNCLEYNLYGTKVIVKRKIEHTRICCAFIICMQIIGSKNLSINIFIFKTSLLYGNIGLVLRLHMADCIFTRISVKI